MNKVDSKLMTSGLSSLYNPNKVYSLGELCRTENNGVIQVWEWYSNVESLAGKNPLDEANRQVGWTDETKPYYWTPAKSARAGTVLFPWLSETFPEGTLSVAGNSVPTAVFWRLAEAFPELISGDNIDFPDTGGEFFVCLTKGAVSTLGVNLAVGRAICLKAIRTTKQFLQVMTSTLACSLWGRTINMVWLTLAMSMRLVVAKLARAT